MNELDNQPRMLTLRKPSPVYLQWLMWVSISGIIIGLGFGIVGRVASSCIILGISVGAVCIIRFLRSIKRRKIEIFVPMGISIGLIVVALTLPHAR